jgi:alkylation response protein AidB-like acyl-CoA dehydrogenase
LQDLDSAAHAALRSGAWELPRPGSGATPERHRALATLARQDLSLARIAEAHADARAILAEGGGEPRPGLALYGVWAADGPQSRVTAQRCAGYWRLEGLKQYCSGATFLDAALVTAHVGDEVWLFDVELAASGVEVQPSTWATPALGDTATCPVAFHAVSIPDERRIGTANWYLERPGFWHGAVGPAACWAGGALFLLDALRRPKRSDPHALAHWGALEAAGWGMTALLDQAGQEIDADPLDQGSTARRRALMLRHLIERGCTEVLDRFGRATGPALLAFDAGVARQYAGLSLYVRQCHAERDLAVIPP